MPCIRPRIGEFAMSQAPQNLSYLTQTKIDELTHTRDGGLILQPELLDAQTKELENIESANAALNSQLKRDNKGRTGSTANR